MRLRAEDKEKGSVCALRKKRRNWHARSAEGKEQELDVWRAEDKEWGRHALTRLSIPEDKGARRFHSYRHRRAAQRRGRTDTNDTP